MAEHLAGTVRGWATCRSLALTVPCHLREALGFKKGDHFAVKTDGPGRIIYEKIPGRQDPATNEDSASQFPHDPISEVSG